MSAVPQYSQFKNSSIPSILLVTSDGIAQSWIDYDDYAIYKANDKIIWSLGKNIYTLHGGFSSITNAQSTLEVDSIIAIRNESGKRRRMKNPTLNNIALFNRDGNQCAYCGNYYSRNKLTRDHVIPVSKGGKDIWTNVVTACFTCNQLKADSTLQQCGMELLYYPYEPSYYENLILQNRKINKAQYEYLIVGVSKHSRIHQEYEKLLNDNDQKI